MVGQAVTYTATVSAIVATGSITFEDAGTAIAGCADQAMSFSTATCTVTGYAAAGTHSITATYSGDIDYLASTSSPLTQAVEPAATTTTVSSASNPSQVGQAVTYTATLNIANATGTVAFQDAGTTITGCGAQTVKSGSATCTVASYATAGEHAITATYGGDGNYIGSTSSPSSQVVSRASTSTTLTSSVNPSTFGEGVTYTATVSPAAAIGAVAFDEGGAPIAGCTAQTVSSGTATCTLSGYAAAGTHSIAATYSGDGNYLASTSSDPTQTVLRKATATTLSSSLDPSMVGQAVTYTATVNAIVATGSITFEDAGTAIAGCADQTVSFGSATCTVAGYATAGEHAITATYSGDSNYIGSTSSPSSQVVSRASTSTTLTSSVNPSRARQPVTYTVKVSPATVTGAVVFDEAGTPIVGCTAQTVSSGTATCTLSGYTAAATHSITATYSGDGNYLTSASPSLTQVVDKTGTTKTTTTLSSSLNPSTAGEAVTYSATVDSAAATGTVEFKQAGVTIRGCEAQPVSSGNAKCTVANPPSGLRTMTASYYGDGDYAASTSPGMGQMVNKKATTTALSPSLNPSTVGEAVTYTAAVSPVTATGTVEFKQAGNAITGCTAQTISAGTTTCTVTGTAAGSHSITVNYSGDSNYAVSTSPALTQTVNKIPSTTTLASSLNPSTVGQAVTYTATVSPATVTGTVEFKHGGEPITGCTAQTVNSGSATCTTAGIGADTHSITAIYSGDSNYTTSTSPALTQTVNKIPSTTTLASSLNPSTVGQAVTYTATVSPATVTGTVAFQEEGAPITGCTTQTISSGTASCTVTGYPSWSSYAITASYSGDSNHFTSASSTLTQTVDPPAESGAPVRFFSPTSAWNEPLPANAPLDPSSAAVVGAFDEEIAAGESAGGGPTINTTRWSFPVYTVPASQPTVKITVTTENARATPALQAALDAVPLPSNAQPAAGTDKHLVVWQPSTNRLWEFWQLEDTSSGWQASWGGAMEKVSTNPGVYGPGAWPGATSGWGATASSLSLAGGLISLEDLELGKINHALALGIPNVRAGVYSLPAQRDDGTSTNPLSLPEGAHLRLDPNLDLASLHLPRLTLMIAEAAQRYGLFVRSRGGSVSFEGQDPIPTGTEPYGGPHGYFEGKTGPELLASFPWSHLELLKMHLHRSGR